MRRIIVLTLGICLLAATSVRAAEAEVDRPASPPNWLRWHALPDLPDPIGVAGPFVGVHNDALIVAGGANFPVAEGEDLWQVPKVWHDDAWVLTRTEKSDGEGFDYQWHTGFKIDKRVAYGMSVSTPEGVVCIGGNDGTETFSDAFVLRWNAETKQIEKTPLPALPQPCVYGAAVLLGNHVYVIAGQTDSSLDTAHTKVWRLERPSDANKGNASWDWQRMPDLPGPTRAFHVAIVQHNGFDDCIYVIGGRRQKDGLEDAAGAAGVDFLSDVMEFNPAHFDPKHFNPSTGEYYQPGRFPSPWRYRANMPTPTMAGNAITVGQSHIFVTGGADGSLFAKTDELKDNHPGFTKRAWAYHTITDTWIDAGETPANHVTTPAVRWGDDWIIATGEVRPRVRSNKVWQINTINKDRSFGGVNIAVLVLYLAAMVGVGFYFAAKQKNTDDYFRGGQHVVWWAAACSIFATMLSSITFMAIPAKAYAQDWVYLVGNMMIFAIAPLVVFFVLPFFRHIDATTAYEYLEKRFNRAVRLMASGLFTLFHLFRMAIVMSLAGLALATVTPFSASQSVLIMGVFSILYCTLGGVQAVIWTDTIQTVVLLGGAVVCFVVMLGGIDGGFGGFIDSANAADKFHTFNLHLDPTSASLALWVVLIGAFSQHLSSYTGDQAVVQRYMTTPDMKRARRSIWLACFLAVPASFLFFGLGTALFAFYQSNPGKLDPTFSTDRIFPLFIADELPLGVAGLIVAGIFAAAQSTVSTSMNSTATAVVTDFIQPLRGSNSKQDNTDRKDLNTARGLTLTFGIVGTLIGLLFVNPDIKSLFDEFLKVVGLFMGLLGGLFGLGILTNRCSGAGAIAGLIAGVVLVLVLGATTTISGFLYAAIGLVCSFVVGYAVSLIVPGQPRDLTGLNLYHRPRES